MFLDSARMTVEAFLDWHQTVCNSIGAGAKVNRANANISDLAVSGPATLA